MRFERLAVGQIDGTRFDVVDRGVAIDGRRDVRIGAGELPAE